MGNLLRSSLFRLRKDVVFWLALAVCLGAGIAFAVSFLEITAADDVYFFPLFLALAAVLLTAAAEPHMLATRAMRAAALLPVRMSATTLTQLMTQTTLSMTRRASLKTPRPSPTSTSR